MPHLSSFCSWGQRISWETTLSWPRRKLKHKGPQILLTMVGPFKEKSYSEIDFWGQSTGLWILTHVSIHVTVTTIGYKTAISPPKWPSCYPLIVTCSLHLEPLVTTDLSSIAVVLSFWDCHINGIITYVPWLHVIYASLAWRNAFEIHPSWFMHQQLVPFDCWVVFHVWALWREYSRHPWCYFFVKVALVKFKAIGSK